MFTKRSYSTTLMPSPTPWRVIASANCCARSINESQRGVAIGELGLQVGEPGVSAPRR